MTEQSFGAWVREQRIAAGWTQVECAERVNAYYEQTQSELDPADRTTFSKSAWNHLERDRRKQRVWPKTVLQASIALRLPYEQCLAAAGYTTNLPTSDAAVLLGSRLASLRHQAGMSDTEVAALLSLPVDRYRLFETGKANPEAPVIVQLSTIFNVSVNTILTGQDESGTITRPVPRASSRSDLSAIDNKLDAILALLQEQARWAG